MSNVDESVSLIGIAFAKEIEMFGEAETITDHLVDLMHYCDATRGVSWARCLEAARRQYQKEVREAADATPLEGVTATEPRNSADGRHAQKGRPQCLY